MARISPEGYTKPKKPKKPVGPKKPVAGTKRPYSFKTVKSNTNLTSRGTDPSSGPTANRLKPGKGGATSAVGIGGMVNFAPWQKQKSR